MDLKVNRMCVFCVTGSVQKHSEDDVNSILLAINVQLRISSHLGHSLFSPLLLFKDRNS